MRRTCSRPFDFLDSALNLTVMMRTSPKQLIWMMISSFSRSMIHNLPTPCSRSWRVVSKILHIWITCCPKLQTSCRTSVGPFVLKKSWRVRRVCRLIPAGSTLDQPCPLALDQGYENGWIWKLDQHNICNIGSTLGFQCWPNVMKFLDLNMIFATLDNSSFHYGWCKHTYSIDNSFAANISAKINTLNILHSFRHDYFLY